MKIFIPKIKESWVVDRFREEFYQHNFEIVATDIEKADIIWIIAPWIWKNTKKKYLKSKYVVCTIHHFEDKDFDKKGLSQFYKRDFYVDEYHVISDKTLYELKKLTEKKITKIPFWVNQNIWFEIKDKNSVRNSFNISSNDYVVGSFQRDTEGRDLKSPKLIKGPDRLLKIIKDLKVNNLLVVLSGKRREYIIRELEKENIRYRYFEMVNFEDLNKLYNCLDLYIVSSRIEGGPQSIVECGISKTPIISTDVGISKEILANESIYNMNNYKFAKPNINVAYKNSLKLCIPKGFEEYIKLFRNFSEKERGYK